MQLFALVVAISLICGLFGATPKVTEAVGAIDPSIPKTPVSPDLQNGWQRVGELALPGVWGRLVSEGLTHDDEHWLLSSKHVLYKAEKKSLKKLAENKHAIPQELRDMDPPFNHIGDIDCDSKAGVLYGGIESGPHAPGYLAAWNATDLSMIRYTLTEQNGVPWVAINPTTRLLYTTHWNEESTINVFDMDTFEQRQDLTILVSDLPGEIQGAAFYSKDPSFLYLFVNGKESVYKVDLNDGSCQFVLSDKVYKHHEAEAEGITFWDLEAEGKGQMHMFGNFESIQRKGIHSYKDVRD